MKGFRNQPFYLRRHTVLERAITHLLFNRIDHDLPFIEIDSTILVLVGFINEIQEIIVHRGFDLKKSQ